MEKPQLPTIGKVFMVRRSSPNLEAFRQAIHTCIRPRLELNAVEAANDAYRDVVVTD